MEARLGEVDRRELMTLSEAKEVLRDVQRQRAGEAGLSRVRRANERLAAAYPVPHPRPRGKRSRKSRGPRTTTACGPNIPPTACSARPGSRSRATPSVTGTLAGEAETRPAAG